jgi:hypothetical protein
MDTNFKNFLATEDTARQRRNQEPLATEGTEITEPQIEFSIIPLPRRCEKIDFVLFHVIPAKAGIQCFQHLSSAG